jgi:hypothetical protein
LESEKRVSSFYKTHYVTAAVRLPSKKIAFCARPVKKNGGNALTNANIKQKPVFS